MGINNVKVEGEATALNRKLSSPTEHGAQRSDAGLSANAAIERQVWIRKRTSRLIHPPRLISSRRVVGERATDHESSSMTTSMTQMSPRSSSQVKYR